MQDEEIDKLITDAANQHHPPYDDKSWGKMEALLDEHLPVKKDRRRYVLFILLFLLSGAAIGTALLQPWKNNAADASANTGQQSSPVIAKASPVIETGSSAADQPAGQIVSTESSTATASKTDAITGTTANTLPINRQNKGNAVSVSEKNQAGADNKAARNNHVTYIKKGKTSLHITNGATAEDAVDNTAATLLKKKIADTDNTAADNTSIPADVATSNSNKMADEQKNTPANVKTTDSVFTSSDPQTEIAKNKPVTASNKKKTDKSFTNNFAITATAGADMSYIELSQTGKTEFLYGAGLTYFIGKHLRAGAGLYTTKKIYTAAPYQYKFAGGTAYPNLTGVDANCKVYEIPVSLYYNFGAAKKHNWFGGLSISSLLMKKETYDYLYKNPAGQTYNYVKTISNENKHYFSVLTLSGGYQYNLNNRFALLAEPYLKLPLTGIGAGKIKLNSTGLLFTAVFKPFSKSK